ncbi:MAG: PilZ domain-containing protein, partial [Syntrophaceae bacterium]|nr:PilZ domain-containing protein [Syntrophaceae bacterium]
MKERRKAERIKECNEITVSVIPGETNLPKEKISYNYSEDISVSGAKIRGNILLPIDTLLKIDFTLETLKKQITALGKVKWIKIIIKDEYYQAGIEFVNTASEAIQKIQDYIAWKQKSASLKSFWISAKYNEEEKRRNELFQALAEQSSDIILLVNREGII